MKTDLVTIPTERIVDWASFHDVFAETLGFPAFYGRNMNAWNDCMTSADQREHGMLKRAVAPGELLTLRLNDAADFAARCPEQFNALIECTAFVNHARVTAGEAPVILLLLTGHFSASKS